MSRPHHHTTPFLALVALLLACETDPLSTPTGAERIAGRITGPAGPIEGARVDIEESTGALEVQAVSDRDGRFDIPVNPGQYRVTVATGGGYSHYGRTGPVDSRRDADLLTVAPGAGTVVADFALGGLEIVIEPGPHMTAGDLAVTIYNTSRDGGGNSREITAEPLTFSRPAMAPGTYFVQIRHEERWLRGPAYWLPGVLAEGDAAPIVVEPGVTTVIRHEVPEPARVTFDMGGAWTNEIPLGLGLWTTRASGRGERIAWWEGLEAPAVVQMAGVGTVRARIEIGEFGNHGLWLGGNSFEEATPFEVGPGVDLDLGLFEISAVECQVVRGDEWFADTVILRLVDERGNWVSRARTDQRTVRLPVALPGTYLLSIEHRERTQTWALQFYDRSPVLAEATPIDIRGVGDVVSVTVTLERGGLIEGRLLEPDGSPVADAELWIEIPAGRWSWPSRTDRVGLFRFTGLPDGEAFVRARRRDQNTVQWYPGVVGRDRAEPIVIDNAAEITDLEFTLLHVNSTP